MSGGLLVIAHEATRTGSPAVLLRLLTAARHDLPEPVTVRLLADGPLADELRGIASGPDDGAGRPDVVLVNSALAAGELRRLPDDVPAAVYVHEQAIALGELSDEALQALRERATVVLSVSEATTNDLLALGVDAERIRLLPPAVQRPRPDEAGTAAVRRELGLRDDQRLVLGCGVAAWRKGADLFVPTCARLAQRDDLVFAWVGQRHRTERRRLDHDTQAAGLTDRLRWIGEVDDTSDWLSAADVLVMCSREDPQPLVPFEAAECGTPTAGFDVGGLVGMGRVGAAVTVPFPDVAGLAGAAESLLDDPSLARSTVDAATALADRDHDLTVVASAFAGVLNGLAADGRATE